MKKTKKFDEEGNEVEDDSDHDDPEYERDWSKWELEKSIAPSSCIIMNQDDKFLIERVKNLDDSTIANTHYTI